MHEDLSEKKHRARQAWDAARETPIITDELKPRKLLYFIQIIICTFVGILVFGLAFFSKASLLLLINLCSKTSATIETKPYALLFIGCLLIAPCILLLIKSIWKITFKDSKTPSTQTLLWIVAVETLVALGSSVLTLVSMPRFDVLTNVMLLNGISTLSAVLQVVANAVAHGRRRFIATSLAAVIFSIAGFIFFVANYLRKQDGDKDIGLFVGLAIGGIFLVSLNWWENYAMLFNIVLFQNTIRDIKRSRNFVNIVASLVRITVTSTVLGAYVKLSGQDWSSVLNVEKFTEILVLSLFAIQVLASALCRYMAVVACKMHAVRRSFLIPMIFTSPAMVGAFALAIWIPVSNQQNASFSDYCSTFAIVPKPGLDVVRLLLSDLTRGMCHHISDKDTSVGFGLLGLSLVSWWLGLVLCTLYIWFLNMGRIARTKDLFVCDIYEAAFIDQSMLLNTKFEIVLQPKQTREQEKVTIYLCATMWHETADEMLKMIISMFRLDKFRPKKNQFNDVVFESHIYFDDAFLTKDNKRCVNEYAETLVDVIREVYVIFTEDSKSVFRNRKQLPDQKIFQTPYGCRLQYTLPHGNLLFVHFKDKHQIRHKKRWSQIMYMYYLLGWRLHKQYYDMYLEGDEQLTVIEDQLKKAKQNTYILAIDGDTDFQPSAVMLLVDRLKLYPEVGAACGRIHPTGTGPMVWYQKFEYAVGHWLQKTAEHVFGSVLCSPGCFSLMRAEALMSDNVMKRYTTKATEASHCLQYDQGEDRWLCTLLLQQGWRVEYNAASDSYTNAPQEFKEFYNQRRRWGPSTMANTLDLLSSGTITAQLNKSISRPYILYQTFTMAASILGPATVCLMIAGSFKFVLKVNANVALVMAVVPPAIYMILCFCLGQAKSDLQISIAGIMSIIYAFLMTATILSIIGDMVMQQTFMTPSGLFFIGIIVMYISTALLHPHEFHLIIFGFLYIICIPSGYLLLAIYSMVNMNNVSWGTRESANQTSGPDQTITKNVKCQKLFKICGYNFEFQVNKEEKVMSTLPENASEAPLQSLDTEVFAKPKEKPFIDNYFIEQLAEHSGELALRENRFNLEEGKFWKDLIELYLKPLETDKRKEEKIKADLKVLRDKATFVFFICNALWLVATFFLQAIGSAVSIRIPKVFTNGTVDPDGQIFIDPIGLMFLLSFAGLLLIQFLAMLWHRIQTLIHFIAYTGTQAEVNRNMRNQAMVMISEENEENEEIKLTKSFEVDDLKDDM
ncbi:chitin synthase chs-2-like [Tachysurus ichikawai]